MEQDQQFLEYVVKALADHPEDVKITRTVDEMGFPSVLSVIRAELGKFLGAPGKQEKR